ncbi:hypothetical protein J2W91_002103 [Paenibacillus amylolyticus]|uniref:Uncharacterized protein n=1 Tax=Paenibacillus amylolyticus TaxID=1451 RepID=A0AAP5H2A1_PAEAM|nr:hypothetical protein [Paenibacillus amylolyticus]MDR6723641.1 hypothetical protein [Paenibacillus amylolyticus]
MNSRLILIDGMPGSGKSTTGLAIHEQLNEQKIANVFYHELDDHHPLRIYDRQFTSFSIVEEAEWFIAKVEQLFTDFVNNPIHRNQITIVESSTFQNTIGFAYNMQMSEDRIMDLTRRIQNILSALNPELIYVYQDNVEQHWRWICDVRGPEFTQGRCGLYSDDDFVEAGKFWTKNQDFVCNIVQHWDIPKLIIQNKGYKWDEYKLNIFEFLKLADSK